MKRPYAFEVTASKWNYDISIRTSLYKLYLYFGKEPMYMFL